MATFRLSVKKNITLSVALLVLCAWVTDTALASQQIPQTPLTGKSIPKYVDPLPTFVGSRVPAGTAYTVTMEELDQQVLPAGFPKTTVWGYKIIDSTGKVYGPLWPGFTVEAQKGTPVTATYLNNLVNPRLQKYLTEDQTLHWADPLQKMCTMKVVNCLLNPVDPCCQPYAGPIPTVVHLHGAEVKSDFDGGPDQWFTTTGLRGGAFRSYAPLSETPTNGTLFHYPNDQEATTLFFHDHALGATRTNVFSGLAAFYFIRDTNDSGLTNNPLNLPAGPQEIEIAIQDRQFDTNGQLLFPDGFPAGLNGPPTNPSVHPFWIPEFFGDTIAVNGKSWPYLQVEPKRYRFRFVDGSNARFYNMAVFNLVTGTPGPPIWVIGTDGGLLDAPAQIAWPNRLLMAPGERYDTIVDFSGFAGQTLTLVNNAKAPFPSGAPADPQTTGQIMQFRVASLGTPDTSCNPALLPPTVGACNLRPVNPIIRLVDPAMGTIAPGVTVSTIRQLVLKEIAGPGGPLEVTLNNTKWSGIKESTMTTGNPTPIPDSFPSTYTTPMGLSWLTEGPRVGSTEEWEIVNLTADAHPIHLHLVQFQLINRQPFQANKYINDWMAAFPGGVFTPGDGPPYNYSNSNNPTIPPSTIPIVGGNVYVTPYLQGAARPPLTNESGWKDTVVMYPGEVTRIAVRWAPQDILLGNVTAGMNKYVFDPTNGPGYVWHCHIIDHEDNEMMRPYRVMP
jgi:spore coat protein A